MSAIEVTDLAYAYGAQKAVDGISFAVQPGRVLGFLGPNGAGKSTTIKMLTGLLRPQGGTARVLGLDVTRDRGAIQARIGVCFEEKNLYTDMSGRENLLFFARLFGIRAPDIDGLLDQVGLADRGRDRVEGYSKGMRQRLMMARALVNKPDVLFLDEPTDGLDPVSSEAVRTLIRTQADRGAAVLLTTHDMAEADALSDEVAFLDEGRIHALDTPESLKLKHGRRSVKVRIRGEDGVTEHTVDLETPEAGARLGDLTTNPGLLTIHTEEATLESIFIQMTGRGLE